MGGYRLGPGTRALPLILDEQESLAVAVALREAALSGILGSDQAALSALLKLQQGLPRRIADRLSAMDAAFVHTSRSAPGQIGPGRLLELATLCRRGERARMSYRALSGKNTVREVDPYRLVRTGHRWYLVARDVAKGEWRTFRADRVTQIQATGPPVEIVDPPDPAAFVSHGLTQGVYPHSTTIRVAMPMDQALELIRPTIGAHRPDGPDATVVEIGGTTADSLARYLLGLGVPVRVLAPDDVREALRRRTRELLDANTGSADVEGGVQVGG